MGGVEPRRNGLLRAPFPHGREVSVTARRFAFSLSWLKVSRGRGEHAPRPKCRTTRRRAGSAARDFPHGGLGGAFLTRHAGQARRRSQLTSHRGPRKERVVRLGSL